MTTNNWVVFSFGWNIYDYNITCTNVVCIIRYYFRLYPNGFIGMEIEQMNSGLID